MSTKEFTVVILGSGSIIILGVVVIITVLSRLRGGGLSEQEVADLQLALAPSFAGAITFLGVVVYCVIHQLKLRRSQHSPK